MHFLMISLYLPAERGVQTRAGQGGDGHGDAGGRANSLHKNLLGALSFGASPAGGTSFKQRSMHLVELMLRPRVLILLPLVALVRAVLRLLRARRWVFPPFFLTFNNSSYMLLTRGGLCRSVIRASSRAGKLAPDAAARAYQ